MNKNRKCLIAGILIFVVVISLGCIDIEIKESDGESPKTTLPQELEDENLDSKDESFFYPPKPKVLEGGSLIEIPSITNDYECFYLTVRNNTKYDFISADYFVCNGQLVYSGEYRCCKQDQSYSVGSDDDVMYVFCIVNPYESEVFVSVTDSHGSILNSGTVKSAPSDIVFTNESERGYVLSKFQIEVLVEKAIQRGETYIFVINAGESYVVVEYIAI